MHIASDKGVINLNTKEVTNLALQLAGMNEIPADSAIHVEGENQGENKRELYGSRSNFCPYGIP